MDQPDDRPVRVIYTGAACQRNPGGPGGWGFVIFQDGQQPKENRGGMALLPTSSPMEVTSQRMELMAVFMALESLDRPARVTLFSSSRYVIDAGNSNLGKWKRNGWMTSAKRAHEPPGQVANKQLWQRVDKARGLHEVRWKHVPRHAGDPHNERAHELAVEGMEAAAFNSPESRAGSAFTWNSDHLGVHFPPAQAPSPSHSRVPGPNASGGHTDPAS